MTSTNRKKIYFSLFWMILITSFIFFACLLISVANGYHFNYRNFHLQKTGMIVLNGNTSNVEITLNGKEKKTNFPARYSKIFPGHYDVNVTKNGYYSWSKSFKVDGGQAVVIKDLTLFIQEPKISETTDTNALQKINKDYTSQNANIKINGNEIYYQNILVTRFSQKPLAAIYDGGTNRIFAQIANTIHVLDIDGSNDATLINLQNDQPTFFNISGKKLLFIDGDKAYQAQIRE